MLTRISVLSLATLIAAHGAPAVLSAQNPAAAAQTLTYSPNDTLPNDTAVTVGTLPNGLKYYIRSNKKPENRAEFRLVVKAGSLMEDDDQRGLAHPPNGVPRLFTQWPAGGHPGSVHHSYRPAHGENGTGEDGCGGVGGHRGGRGGLGRSSAPP